MTKRNRLSLLTTAAVVVFCTVTWAEAINYDELVQKLNSAKFSDRQSATQRLQDAGTQAFPTLIEAAKSDSREVSVRAIEILKHHFQNGDKATKAAAKGALESLANADLGGASSRAKQALKPKEDDSQQFPAPPNIQFGGARIQIQMQALGGNRRSVKTRIVNGVKDIEAVEGDRKVKIHDDPNNGIKMEVTEKKNGKEETKKYEAKDANDLKKKHPEAHKIYEEYAKGQGGIQIRGIQIQGGQIPAIPVRPPRLPGNQFEKSKQNLDRIIEQYKKKIEQNNGNAEHFRKAIENLEKHKKHIEDIQKRLNAQLNRGKEIVFPTSHSRLVK